MRLCPIGKGHVLGRLRTECEEIRTLIPDPSSQTSSEMSTTNASSLDISPMSSRKSSGDELPSSPDKDGENFGHFVSNPGLSMEDLDLLPTRDATPTNDLSAGRSLRCHVGYYLRFCRLKGV